MEIIDIFLKTVYNKINKKINIIKYKKNKMINNNNPYDKCNNLYFHFGRFNFNINRIRFKYDTIVLNDNIKKESEYLLKKIKYYDYLILEKFNIDEKYFKLPKSMIFYNKTQIYCCYKNNFIDERFLGFNKHKKINNEYLILNKHRFIKNIIESLNYLYSKDIIPDNINFDNIIYDIKDKRYKIYKLSSYKKIRSPESYLKNYLSIVDVKKYENIWFLGVMIFRLFCLNIKLENMRDYMTSIYIEKYNETFLKYNFENKELKYNIRKNVYSFSNKNIYKTILKDDISDILFKKILNYDYKKRLTIEELIESDYYKLL
jgi:hypothetical protein